MSNTAANADTIRKTGVDKKTNLTDLATIVGQKEQVMGPLVGIGIGQLVPEGGGTATDCTVLAFETADAPPQKSAVLRQCIGNTPPVVPAHTLITKGTCWVSGAQLMLAAFRPD